MSSGKLLTRVWMVAIAGVAVAGCGGDEADETAGVALAGDTALTAPPVMLPSDTGAVAAAPGTTPGTTPAPGASAPAPPPATPATPPAAAPAGGGGGNVAAGQAIYAGPGICFTCHGPAGAGTALGPNLTDATWIWFDGKPSQAQLVEQITTGIPQPREHPAPMPPRGSGALTDAQVRDVAAYVHSLSPG